jgi:hypothetical protein
MDISQAHCQDDIIIQQEFKLGHYSQFDFYG